MTQIKPPASLDTYPRIDTWLDFTSDGLVRVRTGKVELGQGVVTAIAQIAANELDVRLDQISIVSGDTRESPDEGYTAGSMSIQVSGRSVRYAASAARKLFLQEAAKLLQSTPDKLQIEDGAILNDGQASDLTFWSLASAIDFTQAVVDHAAPKATADRTLIGTSVKRTDLPAKVTGDTAFIHDLEFDGMLHGRIAHPPALTAKLTSLNTEKLDANPDIHTLVRDGSFIGVISEREDQALRAVKRLENAANWEVDTTSPEDPVAYLRQAQGEEVASTHNGDPDSLEGRRISTTVSRPYIMHGSIGASCAIAKWDGDQLIVHTHSQGVYQLQEALVMALGIAPENITLIHVQGAGCYGHNGADDAAFDAVLLARAVPGQPVRVVWSRSSELAASPLGPAMVTKAEAVLDDKNRIVGFMTDVTSQIHGRRPGRGTPNLLACEFLEQAQPSTWRKDVPLASGGGADRNAAPIYAIDHIRATKWLVHDLPYRASSLRGLGAFTNVYAVETLMDDIAHELDTDPVTLRLNHLEDPRAKAVIERVAEMAGWPGQEEDGAGLGLGFARYKNTSAYCAVIVRAELDEDLRITDAWTAVDAGEMINPDGIANQVEGGLLQSLSWATKEAVVIEDGVVTNRDWEAYPILKFSEVPNVTVEIIDRPDELTLGVGECAHGPTAAAIGNAVRRGLGVRVHDLPLTRDALLKAMI